MLPLVNILPALHSGEPMHILQGYNTHLMDAIQHQLHKIDAMSPDNMLAKLASSLELANNALKQQLASPAFKEMRKQHQARKKVIVACRKKVVILCDNGTEEQRIHEENNLLAMMRSSTCIGTQSGFFTMNSKIKGLYEYTKLVSDYTKEKEDDTKPVTGKAAFTFRRAITLQAGNFNAQHGNKELTNSRGIDALENRKTVSILLRDVYANMDDAIHQALHGELAVVADFYDEIAEPLYLLSKLMKSQDKVTPARKKVMKECLVKIGVAWRKCIDWKKPVFWKMHMAECALVAFVNEHQMCGRASAKGFENLHFDLHILKAMLAPMVNTAHRVTAMAGWQQILLMPGMGEKIDKIQPKKRKKRELYKKSADRRLEENLQVETVSMDVDDGRVEEGYFQLESGNLLSEDFREEYEFCTLKRVPQSWRRAFQNCDDLGSFAMAKAEFLE
jgi:hypothetical protein